MIFIHFFLSFSVHDGSQSTFSRVFECDQTDLQDQSASDLTSLLSGSSSGGRPNKNGTNGQGRFPVNVGITGYVATTGHTVNITDAYTDPR